MCLRIDQELQGSKHDRSLLERCVVASKTVNVPSSDGTKAAAVHKNVHCLEEQYRMHPSICTVVSKQFYNNALRTPPEIRDQRTRIEKHPYFPSPSKTIANSMLIGIMDLG